MDKVRPIAAIVATILGVLVCSGGASATSTGSLVGVMFADADSDGVFDQSEIPLSGFVLKIFDDAQQCPGACGTSTTDNAGVFDEADLAAGDYTVEFLIGYECVDYLRTNWLGESIQGFCTRGGVAIPFTIVPGEETEVLMPLMGFTGHLGARLWLDGVPPPAGTPIEARSGDIVCASTTTSTRDLGRNVVVSEFDLTFDNLCEDAGISLFAGDRMFEQTTFDNIWDNAYESWRFGSNYFSDHEYDSPEIHPFFAAISGAGPGPISVRAIIGDVLCGAASGVTGVYGLVVLSDEIRPGCGTQGAEEKLCLGGRLADHTDNWQLGEDYFPPDLMPTANPCPIPVLMGDGNCDGAVTSADITDALRAEIDGLNTQCAGELNTDCNFELTILDLLPILTHLSGAPTTDIPDCPAVGSPQD